MKCPECSGETSNQRFVTTGQCGAGSVEGYTCTNDFHKGFRYADTQPRYSTLPSAKMHVLAAAIMRMGADICEFKVLAWDGDANKELPITGFVIYPEKKIISLRTDKD